jgi:hypothetical protein
MQNGLRRNLLSFAVLLAAGCSSMQPVHKENMVGTYVQLPASACAEHSTLAMSKGKPGERMVCEMIEPVGSHVPKCLCRDEGLIAQQRQESQDALRAMDPNAQVCGGVAGNCTLNAVIR